MPKKSPSKEEKKTRILAIGDIHGDTKLVKKLAKKAKDEKVDLVILAGDLTLAEISTKNLIGPFAKEKKQVLVIPGNHESVATTDFLTEMYHPYTKNIHGYSLRKGEIGIFGAGGADIGINNVRERELFSLLEKGHHGVKDSKLKIMVTHMHPKGSIGEIFGFPGSSAITKAIKKFKPDILIDAHIHEAGGLVEKIGKTQVINVSRSAAIFEI